VTGKREKAADLRPEEETGSPPSLLLHVLHALHGGLLPKLYFTMKDVKTMKRLCRQDPSSGTVVLP